MRSGLKGRRRIPTHCESGCGNEGSSWFVRIAMVESERRPRTVVPFAGIDIGGRGGRTNAWLQNFRRILVRHEYRSDMYLAFVQTAVRIICLRKLDRSRKPPCSLAV